MANHVLNIWLSASAGGGVMNPENANGQNDAMFAVIRGAALKIMTSTLGANIPNGITFLSAIYRGWFNYQTGGAGSPTIRIVCHSISGTFVDFNILNVTGRGLNVNHNNGDFTFDLVAAGVDTLAKLQDMEIRHQVQVVGVTPATLNVDAGSCELVIT